MPTLIREENIGSDSLRYLRKKASCGELICNVWDGWYFKIWPHLLGVMVHRQHNAVDEETGAFERYMINSQTILTGHYIQCFPFFKNILAMQKNGGFVLNGKVYYTHPTNFHKCEISPDGNLAIFDEESSLVTCLASGWKKVRVINKANRPYDDAQLTVGGIITRIGNSFFFNGKKICQCPDSIELDKLGKAIWKWNWWAVGKEVFIEVQMSSDINDKIIVKNGDLNETFIHRGPNDDCIPTRCGKIVTRTGFVFYINGVALLREIPCDECWPHPYGVLIRRGSAFHILVIK